MTECIERQALIQKLKASGAISDFALFLINKFPAADAVQVVRCKDCIFRGFLDSDYGGCLCERTNEEVQLDDFCSHAKSKEQSKTDWER